MNSIEPQTTFRVTLEGIPGAGKTTLCKQLGLWFDCPVVPEFVGIPPEEFKRFTWAAPFYRVNEEVKHFLAKQFFGPLIISDRDYSGILAFTSALQTLGREAEYDEFFHDEIGWFKKSTQEGRIACSDLLLILDLSPRMSQIRQPSATDFDPAFGDPTFLQAMNDFYRNSAQRFANKGRVLLLDAEVSMQELFNVARSHIEKLIAEKI